MIIRFNGANSGIKPYLENGITKDRPYDRDHLDERVILNGDLELVDNIINQIDDSGQKYYHITLAFKEDNIDKKTLHAITKEFNDFFLNSYTEDEIVFYAEAHLPKLKSYHDKKTSEIIERKPHIHIVIPQLNLLARSRFGFPYEKYQDYITAFQEYINCKYGLASPKENRREGFNSYSEIYSRYKGDTFNGPNTDLKKLLLDKIIEHKISNYDEFVSLLKTEYIVKIRNQNVKDKSSYLNIKNEQMQRGVNLKEYVFTPEFINLSFEEKANFFNEKLQSGIKYIEVGLPKPIRTNYLDKLKEWNELVSHSEKYINVGGSKKDRITFKNLTTQGKLEFLKQKRQNFYARLNGRNADAGRIIEENYVREHGAYIRSIIEYTKSPDFNGRSSDEVARQINSVGHSIKAKIISRRTRDIEQSRRSAIERTTTDSQSAEYSDGRYRSEIRSNVLSQLVTEYNEVIYSKFDNLNLQKNSKYLAADILLELVARTHGVIPEKYHITKGYDGTDRINCGNNNYSVSDFLTKELNLKYTEAASLLQTALQMQKEVYIEMGYDPQKKPYLFGEYKKWLIKYKSEKENIYNKYKFDIKTRKTAIRQLYKDKIQNTRNNKALTYYAKNRSIRVLKADLVKELSALDTAIGHDWTNLRKQYNLELQNAYRTFLAEKAFAGDDLALQELRRLRVDFEEYKKSGEIRHVDRYEEYRLDFDYKVDTKTGDIIYSFKGNQILRDVGRRLDIFEATDDSIKIALRLAIQKFGMNIYLSGSNEFKKKIIEYAFVNGYRLSYKDEFSSKYQSELSKKLETEGKYNQIYANNKSMIKENYQKAMGEHVLSIEQVLKSKARVNNFSEVAIGKIVDFGPGQPKKYITSYYVTIEDSSGKNKTLWGAELKELELAINGYVYLAKTKQEDIKLNNSLYHKIERFVAGIDKELNFSVSDIAKLRKATKTDKLKIYSQTITKILESNNLNSFKNELNELLAVDEFKNLVKNDWQKITVGRNVFNLEKINAQEIMDKVLNEYDLYCHKLLNSEIVDPALKYENISHKGLLVLNYEKTLINIEDKPRETYKITLFDLKNQKHHVYYSDAL